MIGTNLPGRVRNVSLALSKGLMPLFEAVSNSIHAIEEAGRAPDEGRIRIEIKRSAPRLSLDPDAKLGQGDIDGFTVTRQWDRVQRRQLQVLPDPRFRT